MGPDGAPPDATHYVPTSQVLERLLHDAAADHVTLDWLIGNLRERSFGVILLVIAIIGMLPGIATFTGLLLFFPAYQMIRARPYPVLPRLIATRRLSTAKIAWVVRRVAPLLRWLERFSYPRWTTPFETTKRVVGIVVALLAVSLLSPLPFSQIIPNFVLIAIAFSFLEADGIVLAISLTLAFVSIAITLAAIWGAGLAAGLL